MKIKPVTAMVSDEVNGGSFRNHFNDGGTPNFDHVIDVKFSEEYADYRKRRGQHDSTHGK